MATNFDASLEAGSAAPDAPLAWATEISEAVKHLSWAVQEDLQEQLVECVHQMDFLRKAQLVQLELTSNADFLDASGPHEESPKQEVLLPQPSELSDAGEAYLEVLFTMQDVLSDLQLQSLATQLACSAQTIREWFAEKRQVVRMVCSRLHKKMRLAPGPGSNHNASRAVAGSKQYGKPGTPHLMKNSYPEVHWPCLRFAGSALTLPLRSVKKRLPLLRRTLRLCTSTA